jgi:archaellum component FlaC
MADEPDNIILQLLRRMDAKLDRVVEDVQDLKVRMTHVEEGLAGVNRRLDRLEVRIDRIETRLDLVESPYGGVRE